MSISRKRVVRLRHVVPVTAVVMVACWSSEAASGGGLQAQGASAAPSVLVDEVNHALELQSSTIVQLDLQTVPDAPLSIHIPLDGTDAILDMEPHPVRAADFQVLAQLQDGSFLQVKPSPVQSLKGHVRGLEGSVVSASVVEDGLYATVFLSDGTRYGIEPIVNRVAMAGPQDHVVYRTDQIVAVGGRCGMDEIKTLPLPAAANGGGTNPPVPRAPCIAELACDADVEYFNMFGSISATQARIQSIVNTMNVQYETQIGLTHQITTILVRTAEPDPYTSTDSTTLLCEFITDWTNNQTAIVRDVAMLFTGKNINGGVIGQAADLGNICNSVGCCNCGPFGTNGSYCLVEAEFNGNFNCATDLAAHELGHLWNAVHCTCPGNTMNPSITCANNFSAATIADIIAFRDTVTCLTGVCPGGGPPPTGACCAGNGTCTVDTQANCNAAGGIYQGNGTVCTPNPCVPGGLPNDNCASATAIGDGTFAFTTVGSNTDGPALPASCEEGFGLAFVNDVWFLYTASCTGNATASLCGSGYDTRMAVYNAPCVGALVACNDDFCTLQSEVTFAVTGGVDYLIRVGGFGGAGTGTLVTSCAGVPIGTGACCAGNGTCTVDTQANCNAAGGTYQGDGTVCTPNPCPQPTGACCAGNGTCTVDTQAN
ncbi:MAG: M12 family metallo-peptidase, partial [Phycisphaerae bacterium]